VLGGSVSLFSIMSSMPIPKVSVVMTAFNEEASIFEAIQSILNQSLRDFELIVIDDGSRADTEKEIIILHSWKARIIRKCL